MSLVVDASVAVKFVTEEAGSAEAAALLETGETLIAPDWLLAEVASALWKKVKFSLLLEVHADNAFRRLPEFFRPLFASEPLLRHALELAFRLRHPVYDCLYLALALREGTDLITSDRAFHKAAAESAWGKHVRLLDWREGVA